MSLPDGPPDPAATPVKPPSSLMFDPSAPKPTPQHASAQDFAVTGPHCQILEDLSPKTRLAILEFGNDNWNFARRGVREHLDPDQIRYTTEPKFTSGSVYVWDKEKHNYVLQVEAKPALIFLEDRHYPLHRECCVNSIIHQSSFSRLHLHSATRR